MLLAADSYQRALPTVVCSVAPCSVIRAVCVVIMNILCCWFRFLKEMDGDVLLSGVEFVQCFQCIDVCIFAVCILLYIIINGML
jgi:hypothetical protein